ncbi:Hvo_1808 family surface protein [Halorussus gelatinilyticus]|uniref:Hvo_1808 family surface protein n=1 Tax=Halorussus gelatinilyticus TaxID=2937524 RepID=A0A8U0IQ09_9EURY|nr:Hvo_1808 family surface protein [Halorussus gelatinilyticus]UPW02194.1 Hvo_1808 family surface protein [Halorussus gelatinilyticus]
MLGSGVAGATLGATAADEAATPTERTPSASAQDGSGTAENGSNATSCAATPPENGSAPETDVKGWENGLWYDASIDVNQDDGVQKAERRKIVSRTMARVEAVRCVEFDQRVPVSVVSREEYRNQQSGGNASEGLRKFDNAKFEALFLVGEDEDSLAVQNANRGSGVLGYYSPRNDQIVVIAESTEDLRIDELTLAHELMHAWQDQQFDLSGTPFDAKLRDQVNAQSGVVEGDASYTETLYERQCAANWECLDAPQRGSTGQLANIGVYLMKYQPYSDGPAFVRMVQNVGGWDAVNALYEDLPESTEQVIHPLRYESDPPTNVTLNDTAAEGWSRVRAPDRPGYGRLGEAAAMMSFVYPYYHSQGQTQLIPANEWFDYNQTGNVSQFDPLNYESNYTTGWDGDRLHVYENENGSLGYVWRLVWDSPQNAQQFVTGYQRLLKYWGGQQVGPNAWRIPEGKFADAFYVDIDGRNVTIVNAPTVAGLSEIRPEVGPVTVTNATESGDANATTTTTS